MFRHRRVAHRLLRLDTSGRDAGRSLLILVGRGIDPLASLNVEAGHDITVEARNRVLQRHRVLNLMTHLDPWHKPDLDHNQARTA